MTTLNKNAAEISRKYTVHAATDVTGFSFSVPSARDDVRKAFLYH